MLRNIWTPLADGQPVVHKGPGELIYLQDSRADCFYYIVSGTAKCFISSPEGEERILTLPHAGELMGEAAFFDGQPRVSSAMAVTKCRLVAVDRRRLEQVFAARPDLAIAMLEDLARRVRLLSGHVDGDFLSADRRIARHLLTLLPWPADTVRCTHEEIGASVGVSRVTVSRVLGEFDKRGWVKTGYKSLKLLDRQGLEAFLNQPGP